MNFIEDIKKAYALIDTNRRIVGVKVLKDEEEFNNYNIKPLDNPLSYCVGIKSATLGHRIKIDANTSGCKGSSRVLGLTDESQAYRDGFEGFSLGLYKDVEVSMKCASEIKALSSSNHGVIIQPIEYFEQKFPPDLVLVVCNPREAMRILQGYSYHFGVLKDICMSGNQGICFEATAFPLNNNTVNVSFLCSGTRYLSSWSKDEVAAGIPYSLFPKVIDGILNTINPIEMDERKRQIQKNLEMSCISSYSIEYGKTYYTELERMKREKRKNAKCEEKNEKKKQK